MFPESIDETVCSRYACDVTPNEFVPGFRALNLKLSARRQPMLEAPGVIQVGDIAPIIWLNNGQPEIVLTRWGWQERDGGRWVSHVRTEGRSIGRTCLILASRLYLSAKCVWNSTAGQQEDIPFSAADGPFFCMAGTWRPSDDGRPQGFAVFTRVAAADIAPVVARQPIVIPREDWGTWLASNADKSHLYRPEYDRPQYAQISPEWEARAA